MAPPRGRARTLAAGIQQGGVHETQAIWMTDADAVTWFTDPDDTQN
ncbi:hypothetical protein SUDANB25_05822 (plasmid) [Streptomyces sp. SudanB25_2051]